MNKTFALIALSTAYLSAIAQADTVDTKPLTITTSTIANTLSRGPAWWEPQQELSAQRYVMDWINAMTVSPEGYVFGVTNYEEGQQKVGVYKDGDNLPEENTYFGSNSVAVTQHYLVVGFDDGKIVVVFKRVPGRAIDGKHGMDPDAHSSITVNTIPAKIYGVALSEKADRLYVSSGDTVKVFKFSDGSAISTFAAPRAGQLALDDAGNVWAVQRTEPMSYDPPESYQKLDAQVSSSEPPTEKNPIGNLDADDSKLFGSHAKGAWAMLDFGSPKPVARVRIKGYYNDPVGDKIQGANDAAGPWTDIHVVTGYMHEWPEEWVTVDPKTPFRYIRYLGNDSGYVLDSLAAYQENPRFPGSICEYSPSGDKIAELPITRPYALAWDAHSHRLLAGDDSTQQVVAYTENDGKPVIDTSFGVNGRFGLKGGIMAGAPTERGKMAPLRFDNIRGLGTDAKGNLYIAMVGNAQSNETRIEAYTPEGKPLWRVAGMAFEDHAVLNPDDETDVYSSDNRYKMDYSQLAGNEWQQVAQTTDDESFPDDRHRAMTVRAMKKIGGKNFLFCGTERSGDINILRFDSARWGNIAIPCAGFFSRNTGLDYPSHQPAGWARRIWLDKNDNGAPDEGEYELGDWIGQEPTSFDDEGNFWMAAPDGSPEHKAVITKLAVGDQLDKNGVPQWSYKSPRNITFVLPEPFDGEKAGVGSVNYDVVNKVLFLTGSNKDNPITVGHAGALGPILARYTVEGNKLTKTHQILLPYDVDIGGTAHDAPHPIGFAGEYIFVGYWNRQIVRVYRKDDLSFVGQYQPGDQTSHAIFDGTGDLIAFKRPNVNEYLIFQTNYAGNSTIMVRWKPEVTRAPVTPAAFKAVRTNNGTVMLTWQASPDAAGYAVERMDNTVNGWTKWKEISRTKGDEAQFTDTGLNTRTYAYRVRAYNLGKGGGASDYTATFYLEAASN